MQRPPQTKPHLNRNDICALIGPHMSIDQIRKNEKIWGLDAARVHVNRRVVLYRYDVALNVLRRIGFDV